MIGEKMMLYDVWKKMFFVGFATDEHANKSMPPTWSRYAREGMVIRQLPLAYALKEHLGVGVHVVNEEEVKEIEERRMNGGE